MSAVDLAAIIAAVTACIGAIGALIGQIHHNNNPAAHK